MAGARTGVAGHQTLSFQPGNMCSLYICCIIVNIQHETLVHVNEQHSFELVKSSITAVYINRSQ